MDFFTSNDGAQIPATGYVVYRINGAECTECVLNAIESGYRLIDTAQAYGNEAEVGEGFDAVALLGINFHHHKGQAPLLRRGTDARILAAFPGCART